MLKKRQIKMQIYKKFTKSPLMKVGKTNLTYLFFEMCHMHKNSNSNNPQLLTGLT